MGTKKKSGKATKTSKKKTVSKKKVEAEPEYSSVTRSPPIIADPSSPGLPYVPSTFLSDPPSACCPECGSTAPMYQVTAFECSACQLKFPETSSSGASGSLLYGTVCSYWSGETEEHISKSSGLLTHHEIDGKHFVAAVRLDASTGPVFTRDALSLRVMSELRNFCQVFNTKFLAQWVLFP